MRSETIGGCVLYLADCRDALHLLSGIDLIITSPPYNQMSSLSGAPSGIWGKSGGGLGFVNKWQKDGYKDDLPENDYQIAQNDIFSALVKCCNPSASLFYNHQLRWRDGKCLHPITWFTPDSWMLRQEIIWDRGGGMMFNARMFVRFDERILWFTLSSDHKWNQSSVGNGTIWRIPREQNKEHPVAFPIEIAVRSILAVTDHGDTVCDPYMGSGTVLAACAALGRKGIGIEISEKYFEIACRRVEEAYKQGDMFLPAPVKQPEQLTIL